MDQLNHNKSNKLGLQQFHNIISHIHNSISSLHNEMQFTQDNINSLQENNKNFVTLIQEKNELLAHKQQIYNQSTKEKLKSYVHNLSTLSSDCTSSYVAGGEEGNNSGQVIINYSNVGHFANSAAVNQQTTNQENYTDKFVQLKNPNCLVTPLVLGVCVLCLLL
jgi:hypothetical protein